MTEKNFNIENDKEFDALIESSLGELPPDYLTDEITPWRKATGRVIWGLALCGVTVNLFALDYILPLVGTILSLLGFRALRSENKNFKACYIISVMHSAAFLISVVLNATVYRSTQFGEILTTAITVFNVIVSLILLICLKYAFIAVKKKAGFEGGVGGATALIVWNVIALVLGLINYQGIIVPIITFIAYICIIKSLFTLSKELDEAGYAINAAPVKVSDKVFTAVICSVLAVCIVCGYVFFNAYPMKWEKSQANETAQTTEIKENLLELGFPEDILNDISDEDILECEGATYVYFSEDYYFLGNDFYGYVNKADNLKITGIGVKLPGERENWKIFHHFRWVKKAWFYGTESIQIWPSYGYKTDWFPTSDISGRVLYDNEGKTYTAPYYFLGNKTYTYDSVFWGESTSSDDFASFSLPNNGENHRGYISYSIEQTNDNPYVLTWINYTHQWLPIQYPVVTATEKRMSGSFNTDGVFETVQDAFGFAPGGVVDKTEYEYFEE